MPAAPSKNVERIPIEPAQFGQSELPTLRLTLRSPHDDRPARGVKARRALRRRTMVAFHKEFRVSPTIAGQSMFTNKITETLKPGCKFRREMVGVLVRRIRFERRFIAERTRDGMNAARAKGSRPDDLRSIRKSSKPPCYWSSAACRLPRPPAEPRSDAQRSTANPSAGSGA